MGDLQTSDAGQLAKWASALFPHDSAAAAGYCRFAPTCGGGLIYRGKIMPKDFPTCPNASADFAERIGMHEAASALSVGAAAPDRYLALCRARAVKRFGKAAVDDLEAT